MNRRHAFLLGLGLGAPVALGAACAGAYGFIRLRAGEDQARAIRAAGTATLRLVRAEQGRRRGAAR